MKFKYKKYGAGILRPVIPLTVAYVNNSIDYETLVDSGADFCVFDVQLGRELGIKIETGERREVGGITGIYEIYYTHPVTLKIGGRPYKIKAGFLPNMSRLGYWVVGQRGFFDIFVVKFDLLKEEIELIPRK